MQSYRRVKRKLSNPAEVGLQPHGSAKVIRTTTIASTAANAKTINASATAHSAVSGKPLCFQANNFLFCSETLNDGIVDQAAAVPVAASLCFVERPAVGVSHTSAFSATKENFTKMAAVATTNKSEAEGSKLGAKLGSAFIVSPATASRRLSRTRRFRTTFHELPRCPALPPLEAKKQRLHSVRQLLERCRNQQERGDFARAKSTALRGIIPAWRDVVVEWLQMTAIDKKPLLRSATVAYAVSLLDSYISKCPEADLPRTASHYQLCAMTAFTIACKFCERVHVAARVTLDFSCGRFNVKQIAAMERKFTDALNWQLYPITVHELASVLFRELSLKLNRGQAVDLKSPTGQLFPCDSSKRLDGIAAVFLDLQLNKTDLLTHSRPTLALAIVRAACEICDVDFHGILGSTVSELFTPDEITCHESLSCRCKDIIHFTFPDLFPRPMSPQSITDVAVISQQKGTQVLVPLQME